MNRDRSQRGFTLIEVTVSMVLLTIGIAASIGMVSAARNRTVYGRELTEAMELARAKMEEKRALAFEDLSGRGEESISGYRLEWTVRNDYPRPRLATIRVVVDWSDSRNKSHRLQLGMIRSEGIVP